MATSSVSTGQSSNGLIVASGDVLTVDSRGVVENTTVQSGGSLIVSGEADMTIIQSGGVLTVSSGGTTSHSTISGSGNPAYALTENTEIVLNGGSAADVTISSGAQLHISSGGTASNIIVESGGYLNVDILGSASNITVESGGAVMNWRGTIDGVTVSSGGVLMVYKNSNTWLTVPTSNATLMPGAYVDFVSSGYSDEAGVSYNSSTGELDFTSNGTANTSTPIYVAGGHVARDFTVMSDGSGGTLVLIACFCAGTHITTSDGEVPVEALRIGDNVLTVEGKIRSIRWIGKRNYSASAEKENPDLTPVVFLKGSLGSGLPRRDLYVSQNHAMFIEGNLIPARSLINGKNIFIKKTGKDIQYFHIELDNHDIIFAEGAATETFIDDGGRCEFQNINEYFSLYKNCNTKPASYCAPRIDSGEKLEEIRNRLFNFPLSNSIFGKINGYITSVSETNISGWIEENSKKLQKLRIVVDDITLGTITPKGPPKLSDGIHIIEFDFIVDGGLNPYQRHVVRIIRIDDGSEISGSPYVVHPVRPEAIPVSAIKSTSFAGYLDHAGRQRITGWAHSGNNDTKPVAIQILINGKFFTRSVANKYRKDIESAGYDTGMHGFDLILPISLPPNQSHVIQVTRESDGVELIGSPVILEVSKELDDSFVQYISRFTDTIDSLDNQKKFLNVLSEQTQKIRKRVADSATAINERNLEQEMARRLGRSLTVEVVHKRPRALLIDDYAPRDDPRSKILLKHMKRLEELGYEVSFIAASSLKSEPFESKDFEIYSITQWGKPYFGSVEEVFRLQNDSFNLIYFHRTSVAVSYIALARRYQKKAKIYYSPGDRAHLQIAEETSVTDNENLAMQGRRINLYETSASVMADVLVLKNINSYPESLNMAPTLRVVAETSPDLWPKVDFL
ncbi:Hint domain-containing protein [Acetobacter sacchari]|uniref:Hint domain-containing protein n=1 Tax=Acetobacter sacchari TaxID=2661687 RepID=A0ABS3M044_9PROT|nr:Hint domain-containing protein [Acetobacter sacchari]MBO1361503.1 Hint domain-containing protein [Acetobacter sacchari]